MPTYQEIKKIFTQIKEHYIIQSAATKSISQKSRLERLADEAKFIEEKITEKEVDIEGGKAVINLLMDPSSNKFSGYSGLSCKSQEVFFTDLRTLRSKGKMFGADIMFHLMDEESKAIRIVGESEYTSYRK